MKFSLSNLLILFVPCWWPVEVAKTEWWLGQKSRQHLKFWLTKGSEARKANRDQGTQITGAKRMQTLGHCESGRVKAAQPVWVHGSHPTRRLLGWRQLLAQPSCTFSPFTLVRTSPPWILPGDPLGAENWKQLTGRSAGKREYRPLAKAECCSCFEKEWV